MSRNITVCVDFDGVCHSYSSGWRGIDVIPDLPVPGCFNSLENYLDSGFSVCIYSARSKEPVGIAAMKEWFFRQGFHRLNELKFPSQKPPSILYIDDRGFHFEGNFPSVGFIRNFVPWNKKAANHND